MAKILITGSADGLGQLAAAKLIDEGHEVYLHSRNKQRSIEARERTPGAAGVFSADLSDIHQTTALVQKLNDMGRFDAIIHNAGVNRVSPKLIFTVNTIAPYLLTALVNAPSRLVYLKAWLGAHKYGWGLSSGRPANRSGDAGLALCDNRSCSAC
jgi:short-subunit dehydrogenase